MEKWKNSEGLIAHLSKFVKEEEFRLYNAKRNQKGPKCKNIKIK